MASLPLALAVVALAALTALLVALVTLALNRCDEARRCRGASASDAEARAAAGDRAAAAKPFVADPLGAALKLPARTDRKHPPSASVEIAETQLAALRQQLAQAVVRERERQEEERARAAAAAAAAAERACAAASAEARVKAANARADVAERSVSELHLRAAAARAAHEAEARQVAAAAHAEREAAARAAALAQAGLRAASEASLAAVRVASEVTLAAARATADAEARRAANDAEMQLAALRQQLAQAVVRERERQEEERARAAAAAAELNAAREAAKAEVLAMSSAVALLAAERAPVVHGATASAAAAENALGASSKGPFFRGPAADSPLGEQLINVLSHACASGYALDLRRSRFLCGVTLREGIRRADGSLDRSGFLGATADMIVSSLRVQAPWVAKARGAKREPAMLGGAARGAFHASGTTQLMRAAAAGDEQRVRELVAAGAALEAAEGKEGLKPLHLCCRFGHAGAAEALLNGGALVDARSRARVGTTPLMEAARNGHLGAMRALLAHGARQDSQDGSTGWTPVHYAVVHRQLAAVDLLLLSPGASASLKTRDSEGRTPLETAAHFHRSELMCTSPLCGALRGDLEKDLKALRAALADRDIHDRARALLAEDAEHRRAWLAKMEGLLGGTVAAAPGDDGGQGATAPPGGGGGAR
jgi:SWI/SNF-related matrix-associated actin-dependent regulator 1 of chromatin subfamily A